ncbi:hypothetical protein NDU88_001434 [Pleurodeles waltl]|uniref:Uncharacterized protein n=1 Tax=Pleurodeles waltl TaxID=8319 RepID=A0AAV7MLP7_PLEWA|nr:hypothetical protein NDU88_001434 [Pleurodeles waltl]
MRGGGDEGRPAQRSRRPSGVNRLTLGLPEWRQSADAASAGPEIRGAMAAVQVLERACESGEEHQGRPTAGDQVEVHGGSWAFCVWPQLRGSGGDHEDIDPHQGGDFLEE